MTSRSITSKSMITSKSKNANLDRRALGVQHEAVGSKRDILVRVVAWLFAFSLATTLAGDPSATDQAEIMRLEKVWNEAHLNGDAGALDNLWAEDLIITVPKMPVMDKQQTLGVWRTGRIKFKRYETSDLQIRVYGETALVTGRLLRARDVSGQELQDDWQFTKIYLRNAGKWQVVAWHASEAAPQ